MGANYLFDASEANGKPISVTGDDLMAMLPPKIVEMMDGLEGEYLVIPAATNFISTIFGGDFAFLASESPAMIMDAPKKGHDENYGTWRFRRIRFSSKEKKEFMFGIKEMARGYFVIRPESRKAILCCPRS